MLATQSAQTEHALSHTNGISSFVELMIDLPYQNLHYQNSFTLKEKKKTAHMFMQWAEKSVLTRRVKGNQDILLSES